MTLPIVITDVPSIPPYTCGRCGCSEGTRPYWIDTGIDIEIPSHADGRLYVCNMCMRDFVQVDPYCFTKDDMDSVVAATQDAQNKANEVSGKWREQVLAFARIGINLETVWKQIGPIDRSDPEPDQASGESEPTDLSIIPGSDNPLIFANI